MSKQKDEWANRDYPVREDMAFQRKTWLAERISWGVLVVLLLLAIAGLFANGPLSQATATDASGRVSVEYDRFARHGATARVTIGVAPQAAGDILLRLNDAIPRGFTIETVSPHPAESRISGTGLEWLFRAADMTVARFTVHVTLRAEQLGSVPAEIGLSHDTAPAKLRFFIYP